MNRHNLNQTSEKDHLVRCKRYFKMGYYQLCDEHCSMARSNICFSPKPPSLLYIAQSSPMHKDLAFVQQNFKLNQFNE